MKFTINCLNCCSVRFTVRVPIFLGQPIRTPESAEASDCAVRSHTPPFATLSRPLQQKAAPSLPRRLLAPRAILRASFFGAPPYYLSFTFFPGNAVDVEFRNQLQKWSSGLHGWTLPWVHFVFVFFLTWFRALLPVRSAITWIGSDLGTVQVVV